MTGWRKRQVMEMALEAGFNVEQGFLLRITGIDEDLERFAELVREDEREACAKVCEDSNTWDLYDPNGFAANLIRTRGQA
jgi:hypothetical protein